MDQNVSTMVRRIKDLWDLLGNINQRLSQETKPGLRSSLIKDFTFKERKLKHYLSQLEKVVNGSIVTIIYEVPSGKKFRRTFTNISIPDAEYYLKLLASFENQEIKILEAKEMFTKNSLTSL